MATTILQERKRDVISRVAMTDEELASILAVYPSFDECEHQEMTDDQFHQVVRSLSGRVPQSVSKWL